MSTEATPTTYSFQAALDEALGAMRTANPEQAVVICDDLLDAYPDAVRVLRLRGQALEALGDAARAAQDYEHVLDISPTDTATALSYAKALFRLGRKDEAALQAQHLLDFVPNDAERTAHSP
ncbi:MAG: tetratricopeptide repeat protein, partial [Anaerolineae bacterium]|nr:tetratricopeptide repeat protein [Anaerolineae bacterium]